MNPKGDEFDAVAVSRILVAYRMSCLLIKFSQATKTLSSVVVALTKAVLIESISSRAAVAAEPISEFASPVTAPTNCWTNGKAVLVVLVIKLSDASRAPAACFIPGKSSRGCQSDRVRG